MLMLVVLAEPVLDRDVVAFLLGSNPSHPRQGGGLLRDELPIAVEVGEVTLPPVGLTATHADAGGNRRL
eukprot:9176507-Lingulodinium_polyedra.AAC.1